MKNRSFITLSVLGVVALLIWIGCDPSQAQGKKPASSNSKVLNKGTSVAPPQNLMIPPLAYDDSSITLIWSKPCDYSNVVSYNVYQEGSLVGNTKNLFYTAKELIEPGLP